MKRRVFCIMVTLLMAVFLWNGCKTVSDLTKGSEERNLIRLKRGSYNQAGLYSNIYYEFEVNMPEGWKGDVDDPPNVLTVNPSSKDIAQSSARKFIDIKVSVISVPPDEVLDAFITRYAETKSYERILERPSMVAGGESKKTLFYGKSESKEMKIITLFVRRENNVIIVECRALKPLFDNVEAQFGACLDSFRITGKEKPNAIPDGMMSQEEQDDDFIVYIVTTKDTPEAVAETFLGSPDRSWLIMSTNEIERLKAGERIKIPRFISYEVKAGDSLPLVAQRVLGNARYADAIRRYNGEPDMTEGSTIFIPLYVVTTPVVGETYRDIARREYNDPELADRLLQYNNLVPLESLERVKLPVFFQERFYSYTVQPNDTLAWIARWLTGDAGNYKAIAQANGIDYPYRLIVGQELQVPASLVSDPTVFDRPIPRAKSPAQQRPKATPEPETRKKESEPEPTVTPEPIPMDDPGLFDIE